jgi:hypothetical protein
MTVKKVDEVLAKLDEVIERQKTLERVITQFFKANPIPAEETPRPKVQRDMYEEAAAMLPRSGFEDFAHEADLTMEVVDESQKSKLVGKFKNVKAVICFGVERDKSKHDLVVQTYGIPKDLTKILNSFEKMRERIAGDLLDQIKKKFPDNI